MQSAPNHFVSETLPGKEGFFAPRQAYRSWWLLIGGIALIDAAWLIVNHMTIKPTSLLVPGLTTLALLGIGQVYTRWRPDPRIAALTNTVAVLFAFVAIGGLLSYTVVTLGRPLLDANLVAVDHALGFDWRTMNDAVKLYPVFKIMMMIIYSSPLLQIFLVFVVLNYYGLFARNCEFMWLFILTSLGCIAVSALLPAAGAFTYFHIPTREPYVQIFLDLRDGKMRNIELDKIEGVIQFPSFHLALAVLFVYATRGLRYWFPFMLILNTLVILATPAIGGHHLADLIGGAVLTTAMIFFIRHVAPIRAMPSKPASR